MTRRKILSLSLLTLAVAGVVTLAIVVVPARSTEAFHRLCRLDGTWVGVSPTGIRFVETFVPDVLGRRSQFMISAVNFDASLGGIFPGARAAAPGLRGEAVRVGETTWEYRGIAYGVGDVEGGAPEIVYIRIDTGTTELVDCDTQETTNTVAIYHPSADGDGDGLPDPDADPLFVVPPGAPGVIRRLP